MRLSTSLAWLSALLSLCHSKYAPGECARVRQPMHMLTTEELMLYADGMHRIRANGKYQVLVNSHAAHREMHRGSSFFFYHTYFVWEVETQIRALGGKFQCFSLPMYDWTADVGHEANPFILNTVLGGNGQGEELCVDADLSDAENAWSQSEWNVRELCGHSENKHLGCCLKRDLWADGELGDASDIGEVMERPQFHAMSGGVAFHHQKVHWLFGRGDECQNCAMATGYSPDDPIFMPLHSFAAYLRAIWASCHGYDNIDPADLQDHPEAYTPQCADEQVIADGTIFEGDCGVIQYDDAYEWEDMGRSDWSITSMMDVTPRMMWDFAQWNVQFNHGTFYELSGLSTSDMCDQANVAQSAWFSDVGPLFSGEAAYDIWERDNPKEDTSDRELSTAQEVKETFGDPHDDGEVDEEKAEDGRNPYGSFQRSDGGEGKSNSKGRGQRKVEMEAVDVEVGVKESGSAVQLVILIALVMATLAMCAYNRRTLKKVATTADSWEAYGSTV